MLRAPTPTGAIDFTKQIFYAADLPPLPEKLKSVLIDNFLIPTCTAQRFDAFMPVERLLGQISREAGSLPLPTACGLSR